jgi:MFS family permease
MDPIVVGFNNGDIENPLNWPQSKKLSSLFIISAIAFLVGFGSSIDASVIPQASKHFHVSNVAESLATGIYLIGFRVGAPFAGPLSETFGRRPVYISTFVLYCIWIMAAGLSPNLGAQLAFRFLAGFFGPTPFTTAGGTLGDLYSPQDRGKIFPSFAFIAFFGPTLGPLVGGYVGVSGILWRWTEWVTLICPGFTLILLALFLPETYAPVILKWKARCLRAATNNPRYHATIELSEASLVSRFKVALSRPIRIFLTEPILVVFTLYLTFM